MNTVRIIGGVWRRRLLRFPESEGLRPTPDRVRETLFNWLGQDLTGLSCLDLFAGSGALGFEAASRGAERVVLVEKAPRVLAALRQNAERLGADPARLEIRAGDALQYAAAARERFDLVFVDAPFHQGWMGRLAPVLGGLLRPDATLYIEAEYKWAVCGDPLPGWCVVRHGKAGEVHFHLLRREENHVE